MDAYQCCETFSVKALFLLQHTFILKCYCYHTHRLPPAIPTL